MPENTKNLSQRILAVMKDIQYLQKDDAIGSGTYAYKAISIEKVMEVVRGSMIEHGLVLMPVAQQHSLVDYSRPGRNGDSIVSLTTVDVQYRIVNTDNQEDFMLLASSGTGTDPQDKGVGKAMTYAHKNLALRLFMIPTGEDADKVHNSELERQQQAATEKAVASLIEQLNAATTQDEVKKIHNPAYKANPAYKTALDAAVARVKKPATETAAA